MSCVNIEDTIHNIYNLRARISDTLTGPRQAPDNLPSSVGKRSKLEYIDRKFVAVIAGSCRIFTVRLLGDETSHIL